MKRFKQFLEYTSPFKIKGYINIDKGIVKTPNEKFNSRMPEFEKSKDNLDVVKKPSESKKPYEPESPHSVDEFGKKHPPLIFTNPEKKGDLPSKEQEVDRSKKTDLPITTIYKKRK